MKLAILQPVIQGVRSGMQKAKSSVEGKSPCFSQVIVPGSSSRSSCFVQTQSVTSVAPV